MTMLKQFAEQELVKTAKQQIYTDVHFPNGFGIFLEAVLLEQLAQDSDKRRIGGTYLWVDDVKNGGITLETSEYPYIGNSAGTITVTGPSDSLSIFRNLLERHNAEFNGVTPPEHVEVNIEYHEELNPKLWSDNEGEYTLHEDVLEALWENSEAFYEFLDMPELQVEDVIITGSSANFNWTASSDLDIHLVVDMKAVEKEFGKLAVNYFSAQKKVFNDLHDIKIKGVPVEFYVQDKEEEHTSTGVYSISSEDWVVKPRYEKPSVDDAAVKTKAAELMTLIKEITQSCTKADVLEKLMKKLSVMRQAGLDKGGEFSTENLVFKLLRNHGYLDMISDCKTKAYDRNLSVEEEEWSHYKC